MERETQRERQRDTKRETERGGGERERERGRVGDRKLKQATQIIHKSKHIK